MAHNASMSSLSVESYLYTFQTSHVLSFICFSKTSHDQTRNFYLRSWRTVFTSQFSPFITLHPEMEFRISGLATNLLSQSHLTSSKTTHFLNIWKISYPLMVQVFWGQTRANYLHYAARYAPCYSLLSVNPKCLCQFQSTAQCFPFADKLQSLSL